MRMGRSQGALAPRAKGPRREPMEVKWWERHCAGWNRLGMVSSMSFICMKAD